MSGSELTRLLAEVRTAEGESTDPDVLTAALLKRALKAPDPEVLLYPAVFEWVRESERRRTAARERGAFRPEQKRGYVNPAQEAMARLLASAVYVQGEGMVPWGQLTQAQHRKRISYLNDTLRKYTAGMRDTIGRHEKALELLEDTGCEDLEEYVAEYGELPVEPPAK